MKSKILLVEDNAFLSEIYSTVFSENDIDVEVAHNGQDGLKKAQEGGWDLILMDVTLPKMSGFDVARELKKSPPQQPNKAIVFLTSLDSDDDLSEAKTLGDGFIKKAEVTPGDLLERITPFLNK